MRRTRAFPIVLILILLSANLRIPASTAAASDNQPPDRLAVADYIPPAMTTVAVMGDYAYVGAGPSLLVIDISDPDHPRRVAYRLLPDPVVQVVAEAGRVYVLTYYFSFSTFDSSHNVLIFNVGEPEAPRLLGDYEVVWAASIAIKEMRLYVGSYESLKIVDVSDPRQPVLLSEMSNPDPDGYIRKVGLFEEYAIVTTSRDIWMGGSSKVDVVDISDPVQPKSVAEFDSSEIVLPQIITDLSIDGNWLAIAGYIDHTKYDESSFSLIDLSDPVHLVSMGVGYQGGNFPSVIIQNQRVYFSSRGSPYRVYDISDPSIPVQIGYGEDPVLAMASADDMIYVAGASGLAIYDGLGPNGSLKRGSLLGIGRAKDVAIQEKTVFVADGGLAGMGNDTYDFTGGGLAIAAPQVYRQTEIIQRLNLGGHAVNIDVQAGRAHLIAGQCDIGFSNTGCEDDLYILEATQPESLFISSSYHFANFSSDQPYAGPMFLQNQIAYVPVYASDASGTGLAVLYVTGTITPTLLSLYKPPLPPYEVSSSSSVAGIAITGTFGLASVIISADDVYTNSLQVLDISNPYSLTVRATYSLTVRSAYPYMRTVPVFIQGSMGFVVDRDDQGYGKVLKLLDLTQLPDVHFLSDITTPGTINDVFYDGRYAYVADGEAGLLVYDLVDPLNPVEVYAYDTAGNATSVVKDGDWIYLADDTGGVLKLLYMRHVNPQSYLPLLSLKN